MFVNVISALSLLKAGNIIAYPTEGVFGLGCDPFKEVALANLLDLKGRDSKKGLILLINDVKQLHGLIDEDFKLPIETLSRHWPGHTTFLFPKHPDLPPLLTGAFQTIAIRLSNHPIAQALCQNGPIVSTSANLSGKPALISQEAVKAAFLDDNLPIVDGKVGNAKKASTIIDLISKEIIRP